MNRAYDEIYLNDICKVTRTVFSRFIDSGKNFFAYVDKYMTLSEIRKKMDMGNWSALNKGSNQIFNSVDADDIPSDTNENIDTMISDWIADIYVTLQWKYDISSSKISQLLPSHTLYQHFSPMHEASIEVGCDKLYAKYIEKKF